MNLIDNEFLKILFTQKFEVVPKTYQVQNKDGSALICLESGNFSPEFRERRDDFEFFGN